MHRIKLVVGVGVMALALSGTAGASCLDSYRGAFIAAAENLREPATKPPNDASLIFEIYSDYSADLVGLAAHEAEPLFQMLDVGEAAKPVVLADLKRQMDEGELCDGRGPMSLKKIARSLSR